MGHNLCMKKYKLLEKKLLFFIEKNKVLSLNSNLYLQ